MKGWYFQLVPLHILLHFRQTLIPPKHWAGAQAFARGGIKSEAVNLQCIIFGKPLLHKHTIRRTRMVTVSDWLTGRDVTAVHVKISQQDPEQNNIPPSKTPSAELAFHSLHTNVLQKHAPITKHGLSLCQLFLAMQRKESSQGNWWHLCYLGGHNCA